MHKTSKTTLEVQGTAITVLNQASDEFISLTDIAKHKEPDRSDHVIQNWMRNRNTIEFLGIWERLHNINFKPLEFEGFKNKAGLNSFVLTPRQWIDATNASGLISKSGRYGGTYAHKDIAFEFASWISVEFKLYLIKEFQRLKEDENRRLSLAWNLNRTLSKLNYRIHTGSRNTGTGHHHLRQRGGHPQCRPLRSDRETMAGCQPQSGRQHARLRHHRAIAGIGQHRGHECRTDSHGTVSRRSPQASQCNSHSPDAGARLCGGDQTTQGIIIHAGYRYQTPHRHRPRHPRR